MSPPLSHAYVPTIAAERALDRLEERIRASADAVTLSGPCGAGKTLLLHVLAHRLDGDFFALHVPYPKLAPEEFCAWLLAVLGAPPSHDSEGALHERLACDMAIGFPPLLLMIDDAASMPSDTLACLYGLQEDSIGYLRLLLVRSEGDPFDVFAHRGARPPEVALEGRMDASETARYVEAYLDRNPVDAALRTRLEACVPGLHAITDGNPASVDSAMTWFLCSEQPGARRRSRALRPHPPEGDSPS